MDIMLGKIIGTLLLPPGLLIVLILSGFLLYSRYVRTARFFLVTGVALFILLSTPLISGLLLRQIETISSVSIEQIKQAKTQAIVILGGGRYASAPEYMTNDTVSRHSLERIRYGAYLQRNTKLPILVAGGKVYGEHISEAELMKQVLENEFLAIVPWAETESRTTYYNAVNTQTILASENIRRIVLVTHASHMHRSIEAFEKAGFDVTPAPLGYHTESNQPLILSLLPSTGALSDSSQFLHELLGRAWYKLRYY